MRLFPRMLISAVLDTYATSSVHRHRLDIRQPSVVAIEGAFVEPLAPSKSNRGSKSVRHLQNVSKISPDNGESEMVTKTTAYIQASAKLDVELDREFAELAGGTPKRTARRCKYETS
jgi:hypothetical protein